jgi:phosphohistidine phosphatase
MKLYLARHGEAIPEEIDPDCPLSVRGSEAIKKLANFLGEKNIQAVRVAHSGKTRAKQTAQILGKSMAPGVAIEAIKGLKPMDPVRPIVKMASEFEKDTLLVGHLPFMENLLSLLVSGDERNHIAQFTTGTIACLDRDEQGSFSMEWVINPQSMILP